MAHVFSNRIFSRRNLPNGLCMVLLTLSILAGTGCRSSYYAVMESFGKHKRDLLKQSLNDANTEQKEASEQFKDTLTQLQELTGSDGGELQKQYNAFKDNYDRSVAMADDVTGRIKKVEQLASDLFAEWENEIEQINSPTLKGNSRSKLMETRTRYQKLYSSLVRAEASMPPVLSQMKDYVLYLKQNLNAQAIGSLKDEALNIEQEIGQLISDMNSSIAETESFIELLDGTN
jgi:hypothetical protein